jgi:hypothetical protein
MDDTETTMFCRERYRRSHYGVRTSHRCQETKVLSPRYFPDLRRAVLDVVTSVATLDDCDRAKRMLDQWLLVFPGDAAMVPLYEQLRRARAMLGETDPLRDILGNELWGGQPL